MSLPLQKWFTRNLRRTNDFRGINPIEKIISAEVGLEVVHFHAGQYFKLPMRKANKPVSRDFLFLFFVIK
jgi:hypothetical protein